MAVRARDNLEKIFTLVKEKIGKVQSLLILTDKQSDDPSFAEYKSFLEGIFKGLDEGSKGEGKGVKPDSSQICSDSL